MQEQAEFKVGDKVMDIDTGDIAKVLEVEYEPDLDITIYVVQFADGADACYADVALKKIS